MGPPLPSLPTFPPLVNLLHEYSLLCPFVKPLQPNSFSPLSLRERANSRYAEQPTARLRIPLKLGAGDVGIYFLQSPPDKPLGTVKCWVDDNFDGGKMLEGTADIDDVMASCVFPPCV